MGCIKRPRDEQCVCFHTPIQCQNCEPCKLEHTKPGKCARSLLSRARILIARDVVSQWSTSRARKMNMQFQGSSNFRGDLLQWDTLQVDNVSRMFKDATNFGFTSVCHQNASEAVLFENISRTHQRIHSRCFVGHLQMTLNHMMAVGTAGTAMKESHE